MNSPNEHLISLRRAAEQLDISVRGLYRLIARGDLPQPVKVGGASKLCVTDLNGYIDRLKNARRK